MICCELFHRSDGASGFAWIHSQPEWFTRSDSRLTHSKPTRQPDWGSPLLNRPGIFWRLSVLDMKESNELPEGFESAAVLAG